MTNNFTARQFTGVDLPPLGQQLAGRFLIAIIECVADVGKVMTELAKAQRDIQNSHAPRECQQRRHVPKRPVNQHGHQAGQHDHYRPGDPAVLRFASVQITAGPACP